MSRRALNRAVVVSGVVLAAGALLTSAAARTHAQPDAGWHGFGNTPDELRHSPLKTITTKNVAQLGRVYTVDFHAIDAGTRRGEQSYPVESNGVLYVTTNDDNVWAIDAVTGKVKWRWTPNDVAVFKNFGIVANRGVALCDGHVFVLTLDMTIVSLDAATGRLERQVPIARAVPGASSNYGYSETSAPICANNRVILGAAGSEYGVRGFVMAYDTNLDPAWPNPFWTIPPAGTEWRRYGTLVGGGVVWTPVTVDTTSNTLYFGTGSATPLYFPQIRPGSNPRADSLIAVDLRTGRMKWWQQQMAHNEWSYDTAQPPLVYTAKVGGKKERVVSVATMEGVWFAYDAATGRPIYQRVKVIDRTEHPTLKAGKPVAVFPSSLGGLNYSPASFDPDTNYVYNAAAETAAVEVQAELTPTQKKRKFTLGDVFLGLQNGAFGTLLPGWHDHGSISAIDVDSGRRVWKFDTPEPERGGVTTTAGGVGFAGGGDGLLRAFDVKNGKVLWSFQTGAPIAAGASVYSVDGREYVAITVGGTPTSSNGGTLSQLQVFALGGGVAKSRATQGTRSLQAARAPARARRAGAAAAPAGTASIRTQGGLTVRLWQASSSNVARVGGRVLLNGAPVRGVGVSMDGYRIPGLTGTGGRFSTDVDVTVPDRRVLRPVAVGGASVHGRPLTAGQKRTLLATSGGFDVGYGIVGLHAAKQDDGTVVVSGKLVGANGQAPPLVRLLTYQLGGTITDAAGKPVQGAVVITRTQDRDFWTHSSASDANGRYTSFFAASDETDSDPVPLAVGVAQGAISYGGTLGVNVDFKRLRSATMNIHLGAGTSFSVQPPTSRVGAVYSGVVVGVVSGGKVVKPLAERWPTAGGFFSMRLPASARGKRVRFWENLRQSFSAFPAKPGGAVDLGSWPTALGKAVPVGMAQLTLPR
jgi:PQQ-dependent dehydrogenase (methanol/ethanol family)